MATESIGDMHARWLAVSDAAAVLGISDAALRLRMSRQAIGTRVDADGQVFVRIPYDLTDHVRAGMTASEALEDGTVENLDLPRPVAAHPRSPEPMANVAPSSPQLTPTDQLLPLQETRIADLKQVHAAQISDLKAVIVELADRHGAEIDRMLENHQAEMQRLVDLHHHGTKSLQEQVQRTAKLEAESKIMLIDVISALSGRK